mgnify:FL=1
MAKTILSDCDKMVRRALCEHGCQTAKQLRTFSNRVYNEDYSVGSIAAALRKLAVKGLAASSDNGHGQQVYWLTEFGMNELKGE